MGLPHDLPFLPDNFLSLPPGLSALDTARVVLLPVPYDSTTSYKSGAREGPRAIIQASRELEEYDMELGCEPCRVGIHTSLELEPNVGDPAETIRRVASAVEALAQQGKLVGVLGGEHTIAVGAVKGLLGRYPDLSVLYLDAHADLRDSYMGTPYSHACTARRLAEQCPLVQVGVRSLSREEHQFIQGHGVTTFPYDPPRMPGPPPAQVMRALSPSIYVSIDLDVFDPSFMAAVGTPVPGGVGWAEVLALLRAVGAQRRIVGFDVSELCPREGPGACAFTAAALVYKLIGYATTSQQESRG
ncbi:MAG: agmatinase [Chloroflexi bacterium]|nr:agmatinase [Chloroflexota bacterium]